MSGEQPTIAEALERIAEDFERGFQGFQLLEETFREVSRTLEKTSTDIAPLVRDLILYEGWRALKRDHRRRINAGRAGAKAREKAAGREGWQEKARRIDRMMDEPEGRKERAIVIANRLSHKGYTVAWRTVYNALSPRRTKKNAHAR